MESYDSARARAFTLIEVLVVVAILALLVAILLPSLAKARLQAKQTLCLNNIRSMEQAHWMYMTSNNGFLIQAGLGHDSEVDDLSLAWITTLQRIYKDKLLFHSPVDDSPHWPVDQGGQGIPIRKDQTPQNLLDSKGNPRYRRTSYGINDFLAVNQTQTNLLLAEGPVTWSKIEKISNPSGIVHFLFMTKGSVNWIEDSSFAGADHPHVYTWDSNYPPTAAAPQMQIDAYGGPPVIRNSQDGKIVAANYWASIAPYGFLDGHAERLQFQKVYKDQNHNKFDPYLFHNKYP